MAMKNSLKKMPRGTQVKRDGLAITVERRDTSSEIALRHLSLPSSTSSLQGTTLQERLPPEAQVSGVRLSKQSGLKAPGGGGVPTQAPILITPDEPRLLIIVGGGAIHRFPSRYWGNLLTLCLLKLLAHFLPRSLL